MKGSLVRNPTLFVVTIIARVVKLIMTLAIIIEGLNYRKRNNFCFIIVDIFEITEKFIVDITINIYAKLH